MRARSASGAASLVLLAASCASLQSSPPSAPPVAIRVERQVTTHQGELHVAEFVRNTPGSVHLSLWIDAGWLDSDVPSLALASALYSARLYSPEVEVRVTPSGTSFERVCDSEQTSECAADLIRLLGTRADDEAVWASVRTELESRGRGANTAESVADRIALDSFTARSADITQPSEADGDIQASALSCAALQAFHADHYGPSRAALFLVGDIPPTLERDAFRDIATGLPRAAESRQVTALPPEPRASAAVIEGDNQWLTILSGAPSFAAAEQASSFLRRSGSYPGLVIQAFSINSKALVRLAGPVEPSAMSETWIRVTAQLRREFASHQAGEGPTPLAPSEVLPFSRWLGEAWTNSGATSAAPEAFQDSTVAVAIHNGSGRRASRRRQRLRASLEAVATNLATAQTLELSDTESPRLWSVITDAGARGWYQQRAGAPKTSVLIAFQGGASTDPATEHGRAALLAYALAERCNSLASSEIDARPVVSPTHTGIIVSARTEQGHSALRWAQRCAFDLHVTGEALQGARVRLMRVQRDAEQRFAAAAALNLSPAQPGAVAPLGTLGRVSSIRADGLQALVSRLRVASATRVAIVGDLPPTLVRRTLNAMFTGLPAGAPRPALPAWGRGAPEVFASRVNDLGGLILTWRLPPDVDGPSDLVARAFAARAARRAAAHSPVRVPWIAGDAYYGQGWAAIAVQGAPEDLAHVRAHLEDFGATEGELNLEPELRARSLLMGSTERASMALLYRETLGTQLPSPEAASSEPQTVILTR